jgi:hypothetical protein
MKSMGRTDRRFVQDANGNVLTYELTELKQHFQLMLQRRDNLMKIGSTMSDTGGSDNSW